MLALLLAGCAGAAPRPVAAPPVPVLARACDDALDAIGAVVASDDGIDRRGEIVQCAYETWLSPAQLARDGASGAHVLRVAYRTTRSGGLAAISTARVLVPDALRPHASLAVIAHGTVGLADACAPSRAGVAADALDVPWAARGWPTIAPDYAGLGTEGVQGYGDGDDTARSTLDAARALRALLPEGAVSGRVVLSGHSQGGGAVLSAQSIAREYGDGIELALVAPIAPGWPVAVDVDAFRDASLRVAGGHELTAVIVAMVLYAWHARVLGDAHAGEGFDPAHRDAIVRAIEHGCIGSLVTTIPRAAPTMRALVDDALRASIVACADETEGCTDRGAALLAWMRANILHGDPAGAPILVLQGATDALTTPARTRCVVDHLERDGVAPSVCVLDGDHLTIVRDATSRAIDAAEAVIAGGAIPACDESALPECAMWE